MLCLFLMCSNVTQLHILMCVYIGMCVCQVASVMSVSDHMDCSPPGSSVHGDSPGKNTEVDCHALLQGIFLTQGLNPGLLYLLHWQVGSLPLVPPGKPEACMCVCVCMHIYILFHIIFHYDLSQDIACNSPCYTIQRLCYLSVILIQKGPLGLSVHCSWFTPMKQLNVPLHSLFHVWEGNVQLWGMGRGHCQPQLPIQRSLLFLKSHQCMSPSLVAHLIGGEDLCIAFNWEERRALWSWIW